MDLHVFPILIPPPTSLSTRSLWFFPVHQVRALVSCTQPGLVICFTLDNIHVLMLLSRNIPPSPSPTESKSPTEVFKLRELPHSYIVLLVNQFVREKKKQTQNETVNSQANIINGNYGARVLDAGDRVKLMLI